MSRKINLQIIFMFKLVKASNTTILYYNNHNKRQSKPLPSSHPITIITMSRSRSSQVIIGHQRSSMVTLGRVTFKLITFGQVIFGSSFLDRTFLDGPFFNGSFLDGSFLAAHFWMGHFWTVNFWTGHF